MRDLKNINWLKAIVGIIVGLYVLGATVVAIQNLL
jgi:hypothetical protein